MRLLFVEGTPSTRDVLGVAAQHFPDLVIDAVPFDEAIHELADGDYDGLIVEDVPSAEAGVGLLGTVALQGTALMNVVVADEHQLKPFLKDKKRLGIVGLLRKPLEALEVYRLLNRLVDRAASPDRVAG